ncbi:hypothetical protein AB0O75_20610 [Streptomyces sp. NPDC088921]|uniref:hypothetical protein n=1 Tax=unclassified Streptomyces TaxID=2593676 RepID=UPI0034339705
MIDYRTQDFEHHLDGYDLVPGSLGGEKLEKSPRVPQPGGRAIKIADLPTPRSPAKAT